MAKIQPLSELRFSNPAEKGIGIMLNRAKAGMRWSEYVLIVLGGCFAIEEFASLAKNTFNLADILGMIAAFGASSVMDVFHANLAAAVTFVNSDVRVRIEPLSPESLEKSGGEWPFEINGLGGQLGAAMLN